MMAVAVTEHVEHRKPLTIYSRLLGDLTVSADSLVTFPHGLLGFPLLQRFALLRAEDDMYWLQSADDRTLALLLVDPFVHFPSYEIELAPETRALLEVKSASDVLVLVVVTLTGAGEATANLRGPVVLNLASQRAMQMVISQPAEIRAPFTLTSPIPGFK